MLGIVGMDDTVQSNADPDLLMGRYVAFVGKLGGMNLREAQSLVREHGGFPVAKTNVRVDLLVVGADAWPLDIDDLLDENLRRASEDGELEIINETQLWERLGWVDGQHHVRQLYTPAMLAELLTVPVATVRRWHRRGLIVPAKEVHRLPYFDFQEVVTARRVAQLLAAGATPQDIENKLDQISRLVPDIDRPLAQLSVIVEGRELLLRDSEGLLEPGGQRRFDFDSKPESRDEDQPTPLPSLYPEPHSPTAADDALSDVADRPAAPSGFASADAQALLRQAADYEDAGELDIAVDAYRSVLFMAGPSAEVNFQLAELLYRRGEVTAARERYYVVLELDEDYVEARANLGCVLAETGQTDLAIAAFEGALMRHREYPDVHFHLARALDDVSQPGEALEHWRAFLSLAPNSPWAIEARDRLGLLEDDEI